MKLLVFIACFVSALSTSAFAATLQQDAKFGLGALNRIDASALTADQRVYLQFAKDKFTGLLANAGVEPYSRVVDIDSTGGKEHVQGLARQECQRRGFTAYNESSFQSYPLEGMQWQRSAGLCQ